MYYWPSHEAKTKFSEVVRSALKLGPQGISVHGKKECVLLSQHDYEKLIQPKPDLFNFLQTSPLKDCELNLNRDPSSDRFINFEN